MSENDIRDRSHDFDEGLKSWASRPPSTDPARAARRVLAALPARRAPRPLLRLAAVGAALVAIILGVLLGSPHLPSQTTRTTLADAPAHVDERVVQFWIDPQTPVYFVLSPLGSTQGDNS
jgi:hypothetical protein